MIEAAGGLVWTINQGDGTLSRIDPDSLAVTTLDVGEPAAMIGAGEDLWVAADGNHLVRLTGHAGEEEQSLAIGDEVLFELGDAGFPVVGGGFLWLTVPTLGERFGPQEMWQITTTGEVVDRRPIGPNPIGPIADARYLWVLTRSESAGRLSRIEMATGAQAEVPVGALPERMALGVGSIWVGHVSDELWRVDDASLELEAEIPMVSPVRGIAIGGGSVWVATDISLIEIDPTRNETVSVVDLRPYKQAAAQAWGLVFVAGSLWISID